MPLRPGKRGSRGVGGGGGGEEEEGRQTEKKGWLSAKWMGWARPVSPRAAPPAADAPRLRWMRGHAARQTANRRRSRQSRRRRSDRNEGLSTRAPSPRSQTRRRIITRMAERRASHLRSRTPSCRRRTHAQTTGERRKGRIVAMIDLLRPPKPIFSSRLCVAYERHPCTRQQLRVARREAPPRAVARVPPPG